MGRQSRVIIMLALFVVPTALFAQFNNNTTSPFSRYGIGDLHSTGYGRTSAMGGAGIASRYNRQINLLNPAAYNSIDSLGFMFEFGVNGRFSNYQNNLGSTTVNNTNFEYMAMNFRISNRLATSIGLKPISDIGYNVAIAEEIENTGPVYTTYWGEGTISDAYIGFAYEPFKNFSIGANFKYIFGNLKRRSDVQFFGSSDFYNIEKQGDFRLTDFGLDFGLQYTINIKEDQQINIGGVFQSKTDYKSYYSDLTMKVLSSQNSIDRDTLNLVQEQKGNVQLPLSYGFGLSYIKKDKLEINADYYHQTWSDVKFFEEKSAFLTDLNKFALGAEWIPDKFSIRSYLSRVAYRAGVRVEGTYLEFGGHQINDFGISFGVGLPIYNTYSTVNVTAEIGRRGTKQYNLMLENYARLNVSVNLYDFWFGKRKID